MSSLNPNDTPPLFKDKDKKDLPIESLTGIDKTAYLQIDLKVDPMGEKPVSPMTAVFAPDPTQLKAGEGVDILLWFHGDKDVWSKKRTLATKKHHSFWGQSVQDYLKIDECKLREFILQTSKKKFLLVVPTLNDHTGNGRKPAAGLLWNQGDAEAYLQQVLNGVTEHLKIKVKGPRNIVLAAHSGGGHILSQMAQHFTGAFDKANEVWCFDCTYWGGKPFITWATKGHSNPRLWVYSTGGKGPQATGDYANEILTFAQNAPTKNTDVEIDYPTVSYDPVAKKTVRGRTYISFQMKTPVTSIDVLIDDYPTVGKTSQTEYFTASYHGSAKGHYESIEKYLPQLVETSQNLK
jgi:hypothetical protein